MQTCSWHWIQKQCVSARVGYPETLIRLSSSSLTLGTDLSVVAGPGHDVEACSVREPLSASAFSPAGLNSRPGSCLVKEQLHILPAQWNQGPDVFRRPVRTRGTLRGLCGPRVACRLCVNDSPSYSWLVLLTICCWLVHCCHTPSLNSLTPFPPSLLLRSLSPLSFSLSL